MMKTARLTLTAACALLLAVLLAFPADESLAQSREPLTLAVHPYLPYRELTERFTPLAEYLSAALGIPIEVRIGTDYMEHTVNLGVGKVDIAFMAPAIYVALVDNFGRHPLLAILETSGTTEFSGKIIAREDSPIKGLQDLRGRKIAFVDPNSTMGYLVPLYMFLQYMDKEEILRNSIFIHSHINVTLGVLAGDFDVGAIKEEVFFLYEERGLRELASTPKVPEHVFVARKGLPPEIVSTLRQALYDLSESEQGREIMRKIKEDITGMRPVKDSDFDEFRVMLRSLE